MGFEPVRERFTQALRVIEGPAKFHDVTRIPTIGPTYDAAAQLATDRYLSGPKRAHAAIRADDEI